MSSNDTRKQSEASSAAVANGALQPGLPPAPVVADDSSAERHARLVRLLRKGLRRFVNDVAKVLTSEDQGAIHDLRVWSRRLQQVLVGLYGETPPRRARAMHRVLRRTRRAISQWRNYDVVIDAVKRHVRRARNEERRRAWSIVLKSAAEARRREVRRARKRLMKLDVFGLRAAGEAVIEAGGPAHNTLDASFWAAVSRAHDRWREAYAKALKSKQAEDVHAFRIRTKRLRYRIELARELGTEGTKELLDWFRKLQDGLGRWRDRVELGRVIAGSIADPDHLLKESRASIVLLTELGRLSRGADRDLEALLDGIGRSAELSHCEQWVTTHTQTAAHTQDITAAHAAPPHVAP
jgi:CHAD domain-containing protein